MEWRNDYFGARYMSAAQGRFTSPDAPLVDQYLSNPQSWNLYGYGRNNPLSGTDPDGRAWQNTTGNWNWVPNDDCRDISCRASVAVATDRGITVYGSKGESDITNYSANQKGVVDMNLLASHPDANFAVGPQRVLEDYLNPNAGANLFNVAQAYSAFPRFNGDDRLVFTGGTTVDAMPGKDAAGNYVHRPTGHRGESIDLRYMGGHGRSISAGNASDMADQRRNRFIVNEFRSMGMGAITGNPEKFNAMPIFTPALLRQHQNHIHVQPARKR